MHVVHNKQLEDEKINVEEGSRHENLVQENSKYENSRHENLAHENSRHEIMEIGEGS